MKTPKQKHQQHSLFTWKKYILALLVILLVSFGIYYITHQRSDTATNENNGSHSLQEPTSKPDKTNDINVSNKNDTPNSVNSNSNTTSDIGILFSYTGQDVSGGPVLIRTVLDDYNDGECTYKLTKGSVEKTYSNDTVFSGTYYSCNYTVPYYDLSNGDWDLTVTARMGNHSGSATREIVIKG